jgi:hypothetical protein
MATRWMTEGSEFEAENSKKLSPLLIVQTRSGVLSTSYPVLLRLFPGDKAAGALK